MHSLHVAILNMLQLSYFAYLLFIIGIGVLNTILLSTNQTTLDDNRREKPAYFINQPNTNNKNDAPNKNIQEDVSTEDESYDAVIVGAGLAGIQAAKTLINSGISSILILEAGTWG